MKLIHLTQGKSAKVDDADFEWLSKYKWCVNRQHKHWYAVGFVDGEKVRMHRFIMNESNPKIEIDHKDRDTLNNQRGNLRRATKGQNQYNRKGSGVSKFLGVSFFKRTGKWVAQIQTDKKLKHIGYFIEEKDAALAYDEKAKELHGDFANLNFK